MFSSQSFNWSIMDHTARLRIPHTLSIQIRTSRGNSTSRIPEMLPSNKHFIFIMCTGIKTRRPCCLGDYSVGQSGAALLKVTGLAGALNSPFICFWQGEQVAECESPCGTAESIKKVQANTSNKDVSKPQRKALCIWFWPSNKSQINILTIN